MLGLRIMRGLMVKDIYIIKNTINNKVYIGQSVNAGKRFLSHKSRANSNSDNSAIHDAMNKLGVDNFYFEILESQIENYNEREKYWISYYNSIVPNGYNLTEGGEEPPYFYGEEVYNATISNDTANKIKIDLINTNINKNELAKKYNTSYSCIRHINYGESWYDDNLNYPLRKDERLTLENEDVQKEIYYLLSKSSCSMDSIAKYYHIDRHTISRFNSGKTYINENFNYPIRKNKKRETETVEEFLSKKLNI